MERMTKMFTQTAPDDLAREGATVEWCRGGKRGVHVKFDNGWTVSIQWGSGTYSDNHDNFMGDWDTPPPDSTTAEVAVWKKDGNMRKWDEGDTVAGWKSWEDVQALLDMAAADAVPVPVALTCSATKGPQATQRHRRRLSAFHPNRNERRVKISLNIDLDGELFERDVEWPAVPGQGDLVLLDGEDSGWSEEVSRVWFDAVAGSVTIEMGRHSDSQGEDLAGGLRATGWKAFSDDLKRGAE